MPRRSSIITPRSRLPSAECRRRTSPPPPHSAHAPATLVRALVDAAPGPRPRTTPRLRARSEIPIVGVAPSAASRSPLGLRSAAFRRCPWIPSTAARTDETLNTLALSPLASRPIPLASRLSPLASRLSPSRPRRSREDGVAADGVEPPPEAYETSLPPRSAAVRGHSRSPWSRTTFSRTSAERYHWTSSRPDGTDGARARSLTRAQGRPSRRARISSLMARSSSGGRSASMGKSSSSSNSR